MNEILRWDDVSKHFTKPAGRLARLRPGAPAPGVLRAVDRVSLTVYEGEVLGLLGESGAGKTTLARLGLRLTEPTSGRVYFEGRDVGAMTSDALRRHVRARARMLYQHPDAALNPGLTVRMIITQALRVHATGPEAGPGPDPVATLLDQVGLPASAAGRYPRQLSTGQKRRVAICRALATNPRLIVSDEPLSGLDEALQLRILQLLRRIQAERGLTLVVISHDIALIHLISDRIGVLYAGRLVELGARDDVSRERALHPYTRRLYASELRVDGELPPLPARDEDGDGVDLGPVAGTDACAYWRHCALWRAKGKPDECLARRPELRDCGDGRLAACHFAGEGPVSSGSA